MNNLESSVSTHPHAPPLERPGRARALALAALKPWKLRSQLWIALIGGVLPLTVIVWLNAERLNASSARRRLVVLIGAIGLAAVLEVAYSQTMGSPTDTLGPRLRSVQLFSRVLALPLYGAFYLLQMPDDHRYRLEQKGYGDLWAPGLVAVAVFSLVQAFVLTALLVLAAHP